jgi:bile acid:Na+ symporter, BASS family
MRDSRIRLGANAPAISRSADVLVLAGFLLHPGGFELGYVLARVSGQSETTRRTIAIGVRVQNSGLGVVLARQTFTDPLTAGPFRDPERISLLHG